jgi:hypothetical protein
MGVSNHRIAVAAHQGPAHPATALVAHHYLSLFMVSDGTYDWVVYEKGKLRFIVLENVKGERVIIALEAPAGDFEEFLPKAQKVLDTVEWKGQ